MIGELTESQIDRLLHAEVVGRVGCHAEGRTYVVPVTYAYDGKAIYSHTREGMKVEIMRRNPAVCFEVDHMENMANWQSAIVQGTYQELAGEEAWQALRLLTDRLLPVVASESGAPGHELLFSEVHRQGRENPPAVVYRITIHEKTGRFEKR